MWSIVWEGCFPGGVCWGKGVSPTHPFTPVYKWVFYNAIIQESHLCLFLCLFTSYYNTLSARRFYRERFLPRRKNVRRTEQVIRRHLVGKTSGGRSKSFVDMHAESIRTMSIWILSSCVHSMILELIPMVKRARRNNPNGRTAATAYGRVRHSSFGKHARDGCPLAQGVGSPRRRPRKRWNCRRGELVFDYAATDHDQKGVASISHLLTAQRCATTAEDSGQKTFFTVALQITAASHDGPVVFSTHGGLGSG
jgi:hypothetical protein